MKNIKFNAISLAIASALITLAGSAAGIGNGSYEHGPGSTAEGDNAVSIGKDNIADGNESVAIGKDTKAMDDKSVAIGIDFLCECI